MIVLAVHFHQFRPAVGADLVEYLAQALYGVAIEHLAPVLGHKDPVNVKIENAVSTASNSLFVDHRPSIINGVKRLQAFKYELRPNGEQRRQMRRFAGSCRFVYNKALALQTERYAQGEKKLDYAGLCQKLTAWKQQADTAWLAEIHSQALQQSLKDLERAYTNFFSKHAAFPSFKKRGTSDSFRYPQGCKLDQVNSRLFLPKLGWMRYRKSREVLGTVKNVTVSLSGGKWYASLQTEREVVEPNHPSTSMVGMDMGVARFATLSDGTGVQPLNSSKALEKKLARAQRRLARKVKFSSNWKKQKARISRIHRKIGNARNDFLHKVRAGRMAT